MPKFLEAKLKKEYPKNPHAVYGTMNAIGAMKGNKETAKGRAMEKKHKGDEMRNGFSTVVHSAVAPAPKGNRELMHIEAKPHRGGVKVSAKFRDGGAMESMEKHMPSWGEAHEEMGKHMAEHAEKMPEEHDEEEA